MGKSKQKKHIEESERSACLLQKCERYNVIRDCENMRYRNKECRIYDSHRIFIESESRMEVRK
jgi:hypothetical protein